MRSYRAHCAGAGRIVHCEQTWDRFVCSVPLPLAAGDSMSWYLALFIGKMVTIL